MELSVECFPRNTGAGSHAPSQHRKRKKKERNNKKTEITFFFFFGTILGVELWASGLIVDRQVLTA
jgi:hypothetical protein